MSHHTTGPVLRHCRASMTAPQQHIHAHNFAPTRHPSEPPHSQQPTTPTSTPDPKSHNFHTKPNSHWSLQWGTDRARNGYDGNIDEYEDMAEDNLPQLLRGLMRGFAHKISRTSRPQAETITLLHDTIEAQWRMKRSLPTEDNDDMPPPPPPPLSELKECSKRSKHKDGLRDVVQSLTIEKMVGSGMYGTVFRASDPKTNHVYALKKMNRNVEDRREHGFPVTTLREVKILKLLKHENIVDLVDIMIAGCGKNEDNEEANVVRYAKNDVFMVFEYVAFDLAGLINTPEVTFTRDHVLWYSKQLLQGVHEMHRNGILNRDIKAANVLITRDNVLKIADWGLARSFNGTEQKLSGPKVITLWYRPPELLLETRRYGAEVDMWSVGCLLAEIALAEPLLKGTVELEQLELVYQLCGTPVAGGEVEQVYKQYPGWDKMQFEKTHPNKTAKRFSTMQPELANLIEQLLQLDPAKRWSASQCLDHGVFWNRDRPMLPRPQLLDQFTIEDTHEFEVKERRDAQRKADAERRTQAVEQQKEKERQAKRNQHQQRPGSSKWAIVRKKGSGSGSDSSKPK